MAPPPNPSPPDPLRSWQAAAAQVAWLFLAAVAAGLAFLAVDAHAPPQHLPWKPLRLGDPIGMATGAKLSRAKAERCRAILREGGVAFGEAPSSRSGAFCRIEDAVRLSGGVTALRPAAPAMTCRQALAFAIWDRQVVQPAAVQALGRKVAAIDHYGAYACRRRYGRADAAVSEHASANALDVAAFRLEGGGAVSVLGDWTDPGPPGAFLRRVRDGACRLFSGVLGPEYNAAHRDHFHLDMGGWRTCR